jgi:hypothetical protein
VPEIDLLRFSYKTESNMPNNIANTLVVSADTQAEIENFLSGSWHINIYPVLLTDAITAN